MSDSIFVALFFMSVVVVVPSQAGVPVPFPYDPIIRIEHFGTGCEPALLPEVVLLECTVNRTVQTTTGYFYCNCTADRSLILKWSVDINTGVHTFSRNITTNVCSGVYMFVSTFGLCGGGVPYDIYLAEKIAIDGSIRSQGYSTPTFQLSPLAVFVLPFLLVLSVFFLVNK